MNADHTDAGPTWLVAAAFVAPGALLLGIAAALAGGAWAAERWSRWFSEVTDS